MEDLEISLCIIRKRRYNVRMRGTTRWEVAESCPDTMRQIAQVLSVSPVVGQILWNRGHRDEASAQGFLSAQLRDLTDPTLLPGIIGAVERMFSALKSGEPVTIYGDYDVDGITSVAILKRVLDALGAKNVRPFLPDRFDEGYGLTPAGVERCLAEGESKLLIVLDCGTNSRAEVAALKAKGVDVIILDHHEPSDPAEALAIVNYKLAPGIKPGTEYCTAGLVFKFCHALLKVGRERQWPGTDKLDLREYLDLVALATVADIAPLMGENRILTRHGLRQMACSRWEGLRALTKVAGMGAEPVAYDCGFKLGPRLNAAGRLESAMASLQLLLTDDADEAMEIARQLDGINRERQGEEARVLIEARKEAELQLQNTTTRVLVVGRPGWHEGVVGIVASRLMREFHLPSFVLALDGEGKGKGSGRSIEGFHLAQAVEATRNFLLRGGGHAMAAGVSLEADQMDSWRKALQVHALKDQGLDGDKLSRVLRVDAEVSLAHMNFGLLEDLRKLEPCGMGNAKPLLAARGVEVVSEPKTVGVDGKHLKLWLGQDGVKIDAIAFGWGKFQIRKGGRLDVIFELEVNEYQGNRKLQMNIREMVESGVEK